MKRKKLIYIFISVCILSYCAMVLLSKDEEDAVVYYDDDAAAYTWASTNSISVYIEPSLVEGNCVDQAVTILNILYRKADWDDVYVAVSIDHAQVVKRPEDTYEFLQLSGLTIMPGTADFTWGTELEFFAPDLFLAAAKEFKPSMTLTELKEFASKY